MNNYAQVNKKSGASLVLGILSIVISLLIAPILGVVIGIIGIIFSVKGYKEVEESGQEGEKQAVAGMLCSLAGIGLFLILFLAAL
ncbi:MAG TPA: DUF4190 domain-containing protein [Pseudogracilibacillus sp.]|nr:DUF4190 domain-containing protein [Pseudogracilibacillus sp.]